MVILSCLRYDTTHVSYQIQYNVDKEGNCFKIIDDNVNILEV